MKKMMRKMNNERGLTLVELLAVIVILAIIGAIAFVNIGGIIDNAKKDAHIANARLLITTAKLYEASGFDIAENAVTAEEMKEKGLLGEFIDPWTKTEYDNLANEANTNGNGLVTKDSDGQYIVKLIGEKCVITEASEMKLISDGREACE